VEAADEVTLIALTPFRYDEVLGLLDVCADEPERVPWGRVVRHDARWWLEVFDPVDAADDLRYRADYLISEGAVVGRSGVSGAVSLRGLAALVEVV
jgi:hypothetical protein